MKILAIETSCDDTCIAVVEIQGLETDLETKILSNVISSQVKIHAKYGGVYPSLAKREHQKNLPIVLRKALRTVKNPKIDLIAVTVGPGLEPCLWVGVNFAKDLAKTRAQNNFVLGRAHKVCALKLNLPLTPVNHVEAHILANFLNYEAGSRNVFPAVCLVVSGGHTQLILMRDFGKYKILGETRDDAAGECFDKTARILGLGYPGGPAIAHLAKKTVSRGHSPVNLPRPMIYQKNYDFSFSGLKTAVLYKVRSMKKEEGRRKKFIQAMCKEVQQAIIDVLIHKALKAAKEFKVKSIILGGGVASNNELRKQFAKRIKKEIPHSKLYVPDSKLCTDNAAMVAVAGYFNRAGHKKIRQLSIEAQSNLRLK